MQKRSFSLSALTLAAAAVLTACGGGGGDGGGVPPSSLGDTIAITSTNKVISFNRAQPGTINSSLNVSGLAADERLLGIDVRPADGLVYTVSSLGRIYTLDPATGVATFRSTVSVPLAGSSFGFDFNPVADRLRLVSNTGQNLRIDVATGTAVVDGPINGVAGASVTASAYTNSFAGATTTQLFNLDAAGTLYLQDPPNNGTLASPVPLGVTFAATNGFDIDARTNRGFAALTVGSANRLYTVPLSGTGGATLVGAIGSSEPITGLALMQPAAPRAVVLTDTSQLSSFALATPNTLSAPVAISGLAANETVLGIDFRPANQRLYALTSGGRLLTVDPDTGAAAAVATLSADPTDTTLPYAGLSGTRFTVDFNPAADRLRVISETGQNLRINVDTGATTTDGVINRAAGAPQVIAGAYTNSFAGTGSTTLFDIDAAASVLAQQNPPNDGTLVDVGALGVPLATGAAAFDIAGGANGLAVAALRTGAAGPFSLYNINLTSGAATLRGADAGAAQIGGTGGPVVRDLAIRY